MLSGNENKMIKYMRSEEYGKVAWRAHVTSDFFIMETNVDVKWVTTIRNARYFFYLLKKMKSTDNYRRLEFDLKSFLLWHSIHRGWRGCWWN